MRLHQVANILTQLHRSRVIVLRGFDIGGALTVSHFRLVASPMRQPVYNRNVSNRPSSVSIAIAGVGVGHGGFLRGFSDQLRVMETKTGFTR